MFVYRTIILTLPPGLDIFSISWLSVWSQSLQSSFAEIEIPRQLNVPPAQRVLGISPQVNTTPCKKLNIPFQAIDEENFN